MRPNVVTEQPDSELARRVFTGPDPTSAFTELFARHHSRLLTFLMTRFPDIAEDVAHDAWLKVLNAMKSGPRQMTSFRSFLFEVARNRALDVRRRARAVPFAAGDDPPTTTAAALDEMLDTERREIVRKCLGELPTDQRTIFNAIAGGESPEEIAEQLGVSTGVVYQRKSRGLSAIRECVSKHLP